MAIGTPGRAVALSHVAASYPDADGNNPLGRHVHQSQMVTPTSGMPIDT
jgi:hypothetical protein